MISCSEAVKQLWEYLDGTIEADQRAAIEEHLSFCRRCCGEVEFARELRSFLARSAHDQVPPEVLARLSATLDELEGR
jgi:mycothiol system anti-sigma-R factor